MSKKYKVIFRNRDTLEFDEGTTFKEISVQFQKNFKFDILVAQADDDLIDLSETLKKKTNIEFFDISSPVGNSVYFRSVVFVLALAIKNLFGIEEELTTNFSMDHGVYCSLKNTKLSKETISKIRSEMNKIVKADYLFTKLSVSRLDAIKYFKKINKMDKVDSLKYISNTYVNLYRIGDMYDYFYGKMAYSTGQLKNFKISYINETGLVLSLPDVFNPDTTPEYVYHKKIFEKFDDYKNWGQLLGINNAADLNKIVSSAKIDELINLSEAYYNGQLSSIADEIYNSKKNIKIVLLAGPSSSGKTTTSKKLSTYLRSKGFITHAIALDDYFTDMDKRAVDKNGKPDFESIKAIDVNLFNRHLNSLLEGKKVSLPTFNFVLGKREYNGNYLQLGEKDIIVIEGLHALNDDLTMSISSKNKYKIYISPLTSTNIDNHNHTHTSDIRKLRRIVRDSRTRGYGAKATLSMWSDIKQGEINNIFKFQDDVDTVVNSSLLYEIGVLKVYAEPLLFNVLESDPEYPEAIRLINYLRNFLPIPSDDIPKDSVLREFIGGGCFKI